MRSLISWPGCFSLVVLFSCGTLLAEEPPKDEGKPETEAKESAWKSLFDGKTLKGWESTNFGGEGEVSVKEGSVVLEMGNSLTGITYTGKGIPKMNYEIALQAKRVEGGDFFCGLTFPVGDHHCSLILGGWGGSLVGLSSLDDKDASDNETTKYLTFRKGQWYHVRVKVMPEGIQAWVDDKEIVNAKTKGRKISIRPEVGPSRPMGISSYQTTAALKDIKIRTFGKDK